MSGSITRRAGRVTWYSTLGAALAGLAAFPVAADSRGGEALPAPPPSYADLADLAEPAAVVARVQVRKVAEVDAERARGLRQGWARLYVEARTEAVLGGQTVLGEGLRYLVDVPRDAKGKVPKLGKRSVVLFARPVAGKPGELQLVAPDAQLLWDAALDARLRSLLAELYAPAAPQRITGLREAIHVPGALAGESETQLFLATANGEPAAITVARSPGQPVRWTVSFSEVVDSSAPPPRRETLTWYRLACFLPTRLPAGTNLSATPGDRQAADRDYLFVRDQLGQCPRLRR
jgi:hypothetical protein